MVNNKKGQVAVFIIAGILIVFFAALIFGIRNFVVIDEIEAQQGVAPLLGDSVQSYVESCVRDTAKEALLFVGDQGGYYNLPELSDPFFNAPYYMRGESKSLIAKEELEKQLSTYVDEELFFCLRNFVPFRNAGMEIEPGEVSTSTRIVKDKVFFEVTFPVQIRQGSLSKEVSFFTASTDSRLGDIYDLTAAFIGQENPSSICVSCLADLMVENDMRAEMDNLGEEVIMFTIIDEKVMVNSLPYRYRFLNRYEFEK